MNCKAVRRACLILLSSASIASAQMIVHAVTGSVKAVTPQGISVAVDDGSVSLFRITPSTNVSLKFPGDLRSNATEPAHFQKVGDFVVLYYYGYGLQRTAVAIKDLGAGPFSKCEGTVVTFDKHSRQLTLKDSTGKQVALVLDDALIIDTDSGVDSGRKFSPHKGDDVRVTFGAGTPATVAFLGEAL
jgi:hypothetical protein